MSDVAPAIAAVRMRSSLRWRLPLLISALVLAVLAIVVGAAYRFAVSTLERNAGERARRAAQQVTAFIAPATAQIGSLLDRSLPAVRALLDAPTDANGDRARMALAALAPGPLRVVTVWNRAGDIVLRLPAAAGGAISGPSQPPSEGLSEIQAQGRRAYADTTRLVRDAAGAVLGTVSLRSTLSINPPDLLRHLIGDDARILFGNRGGRLWTDLDTVVELPSVDSRQEGVTDYLHADGDRRIGALAAFPAPASWVVWVEFPRAAIVASAQGFLRDMALLAAAVGIGAILFVRRLVTGVTAPLTAMTTAAESMAAGHYAVKVPANRTDEIGRLGQTFNVMADTVERELAGRRRALDIAEQTENRYRTLFDYAPDGILIADGEGRYLDANPGICRMLGRTREELIGRQAADIVAADEVPYIAPALSTLSARTDYQREWRFRHRDGSVVEADVIATKMPDGNIVAMVRDVTERNRAVEAVRAAEERTRFALESAEVGIWDLDFRTGAVRWSEILEAQHGLEPGTFDGTYDAFLALVHPDDRAQVRQTVETAARRGGDFSVQHRIVRPDGVQRWVAGTGHVLLGPDGAAARAVGISLDVTARHQLEAQFQQAQKMEAVGRLAGGVAHDFNNLLTAILGYCELVLDDLRPEDPLRFEISEIQTAGRQAAGLTRQLLAFSRKQIIEPTLLDVNEVVRALQSLLRRLIGEDIEIAVALAARPMMVNADRGQIEQVVMNLAVNARDAMPGGGRLLIETAHVELDGTYAETHLNAPPGTYVVLTVTDTGVGMPPDVLSHLFEPFFTTKEQGKGTGLGLATVHGIVTRSGGSVGVYSEVGRGTSFKIYLPRADADAPAVAPAPAPTSTTAGRGRTVLVVDDAEGLRLLMARTLTRLGFQVLLAANAGDAVRQFSAHPEIDVLLSDVVMPGASGPELTVGLRQQRPDLKVIYMSGYTEDAIVHHGVLKPGIAFLHKPFTAHALAQKIAEVLGA